MILLRSLRDHVLCPSLTLLALMTVGCAGEQETDEGADEAADEEGVDLENGQMIHDVTCKGTCHANNMILDEEVPEESDEELFEIIDKGYEEMPPQDQLSDQDIRDVIAYLRVLYG